MKSGYCIFIALIAGGISLSAQAAVTASINRNAVATGETIQLRLQRDGSGGQPDLSPLRKDFDVLGSSSGSNVQIINGQMSTQTQVTVLLSPRRDGKILIPPLQWGGEQSAAIELTVGGAGQQRAQGANDAAHVFFTTVLDQKQPYVQAAVVLTVRLHTDQPLLQASLDFPASSDVLVRQLGKDSQSNETRNGRNYQVVERKYLLFPQRSGKLSLNGPVLDAQIADTGGNDPFDNIFRRMPFGGMMNATRPLRVHGKAIELNVQPRPSGAGGANWLPAQKVSLQETWREEPSTLHVGEPLTRRLRLEALGLTGAQLPDPNSLMAVPEGIKAYPDQATMADNPQGDTVLGSREQNIALIASKPGRYELPPVRLGWWDTLHNEKREITLPARTLNVLPAVGGTGAVLVPQAENTESALKQGAQANEIGQATGGPNNQIWMWLSLVFCLLWLGTFAAWWRLRRRAQFAPPLKTAAESKPEIVRGGSELKAVKRACSDNDPHAARQHLLAWAGTAWPEDPPRGLNELARRMDDARTAEALRQLDKACYAGGGWQGEMLARYLPESTVQHNEPEKSPRLPELYN